MMRPAYNIEANRRKTIVNLLDAATTLQTSVLIAVGSGSRTIQASIDGVGVVAATVEIYGSHESLTTGGILLATMTLSGTAADKVGGNITAEWPYMYADLTAISGASAAVTVSVGA